MSNKTRRPSKQASQGTSVDITRDNCPPVWQYVVQMLNEFGAHSESVKHNAPFHSAAELEPLAEWLDGVTAEMRERAEALTGWETTK